MQLTVYTDYSLRVLIYLGLHRENIATIADIAKKYQISRNHIVKIVHHLASLGFVHTIRGRNGGMSLAREPESINLADVVLKTEPNFQLVECFRREGDCCIEEACRFRGALNRALQSFFTVLGEYTLADLIEDKSELLQFLNYVNIPINTLIQ